MEIPKKKKRFSEEETQVALYGAKNDLISFAMWNQKDYQPAWFHEVIADALMKVEKGEIKRLMITMPPRCGKSQLASVHFPAWYIGKHPDREIVAASYNAELATEFGYKVRDLVSYHPYKALFGDVLREDSKSKSRLVSKEGGSYVAVGVGGALTGRGASLLIIDDAIKGRQDADSKIVRDLTWGWYSATAFTRLYRDSAIIMITTRWHLDDLAGRLLVQMEEGGEQWTIINFPAIATQDEVYNGKLMRREGDPLWPEQFSLKKLEEIKGVLGMVDFNSLYQQNPILSENQEFKPEWIQKITWDEVKKKTTRCFLTVDTAISRTDNADNTGLCLNFVDRENRWHLKAWKARINAKQVIDLIFQLHETYNIEKVGIEETAFLMALKHFFDDECRKRNRFPYIVPLKHQNIQKEIRIRGLIPRYESRSVYHIENTAKDLEEEMLQFPKGRRDDVLDACSYQTQLALAPARENEVKIHKGNPINYR